jgi:hypothetical protein
VLGVALKAPLLSPPAGALVVLRHRVQPRSAGLPGGLLAGAVVTRGDRCEPGDISCVPFEQVGVFWSNGIVALALGVFLLMLTFLLRTFYRPRNS